MVKNLSKSFFKQNSPPLERLAKIASQNDKAKFLFQHGSLIWTSENDHRKHILPTINKKFLVVLVVLLVIISFLFGSVWGKSLLSKVQLESLRIPSIVGITPELDLKIID